MPRTQMIVVAAAVVVALTVGFVFGVYRRDAPVEQAVAFQLMDIDGQLRHSDEWRGRVVLINFWATWCPPCLEEIPLFIVAQQAHGDDGLQMVGVALDDTDRVRVFGDDIGINYPSLIADDHVMDLMTSYGNTSGLPFSVLIGRDGAVLMTKVGKFDQAELTRAIEDALKV